MTDQTSACWCGPGSGDPTGVSPNCVGCPRCGTVRTRVFPYGEVGESREYVNPDTTGFEASPTEWLSYGALSVSIVESAFQESRSGRRLLDIGVGAGHTLAVAVARGFEGWGVEMNPSRVAYATTRFGLRNVACGTFESALPTLPRDFAAANLSHVLEHVPAPVEFLRSIASVLAPDGVLLVSLPNVDSLQRRLRGQSWDGWQFKQHLWHFSFKSLTNLLSAAGYDVVSRRDLALGTGAEIIHGEWRIISPLKNERSRRRYVEGAALGLARRVGLGLADQIFVLARPKRGDAGSGGTPA